MVIHAFSPSTWKVEGSGSLWFQSQLGKIVNPRTTRAMKRNSVSKQKNKNPTLSTWYAIFITVFILMQIDFLWGLNMICELSCPYVAGTSRWDQRTILDWFSFCRGICRSNFGPHAKAAVFTGSVLFFWDKVIAVLTLTPRLVQSQA